MKREFPFYINSSKVAGTRPPVEKKWGIPPACAPHYTPWKNIRISALYIAHLRLTAAALLMLLKSASLTSCCRN